MRLTTSFCETLINEISLGKPASIAISTAADQLTGIDRSTRLSDNASTDIERGRKKQRSSPTEARGLGFGGRREGRRWLKSGRRSLTPGGSPPDPPTFNSLELSSPLLIPRVPGIPTVAKWTRAINQEGVLAQKIKLLPFSWDLSLTFFFV